ncbi:MAG TPA: hypothetical protein VK606_09510 [Verrucomicrobiae bacterium]|nr:hypothetical protein [Verrucomicrobiae bacterium]
MSNPTTVTVGLDVHARSVRLAALRADEPTGEEDSLTTPLEGAQIPIEVSAD